MIEDCEHHGRRCGTRRIGGMIFLIFVANLSIGTVLWLGTHTTQGGRVGTMRGLGGDGVAGPTCNP